jgi:hypothetical protein
MAGVMNTQPNVTRATKNERTVSLDGRRLVKKENNLHPTVTHVLKFFSYAHLPAKLQEVSKPFCDLAQSVAERCPDNLETTVALRKLLEAKDAAVRATL